MNKDSSTNFNDELEPEYNLSSLLKGGVRGKYSKQYEASSNLILLDADVAKAFPDAKSVNDALRLVMQMAQLPVAV